MEEDKTHVCYCNTYNFPHRAGGGKCAGPGDFICLTCGNACSVEVDAGEGKKSSALGFFNYSPEASSCCASGFVTNKAVNGPRNYRGKRNE